MNQFKSGGAGYVWLCAAVFFLCCGFFSFCAFARGVSDLPLPETRRVHIAGHSFDVPVSHFNRRFVPSKKESQAIRIYLRLTMPDLEPIPEMSWPEYEKRSILGDFRVIFRENRDEVDDDWFHRGLNSYKEYGYTEYRENVFNLELYGNKDPEKEISAFYLEKKDGKIVAYMRCSVDKSDGLRPCAYRFQRGKFFIEAFFPGEYFYKWPHIKARFMDMLEHMEQSEN